MYNEGFYTEVIWSHHRCRIHKIGLDFQSNEYLFHRPQITSKSSVINCQNAIVVRNSILGLEAIRLQILVRKPNSKANVFTVLNIRRWKWSHARHLSNHFCKIKEYSKLHEMSPNPLVSRQIQIWHLKDVSYNSYNKKYLTVPSTRRVLSWNKGN